VITHRDRAAWLDWRADPTAHRIGASEVAAVLGLSPWVQPWEIWARRCAPQVAPEHRGAELDDGTRWEPRALAVYAQEHLQPMPGRELLALTRPTPYGEASYVHPSIPWLHATPDALVCATRVEMWGPFADPSQIRGVVEVKTDRTPDAPEAWPPDGAEIGDVDTSTPVADWPVPVAYWLQAQTQIACTGAGWVDLYVWFPHYAAMPEARRIRIFPHPRFGGVLEEVAAWRERHLIGGEPPPVTPDDDAGRLALVRWRYPAPAVEREASEVEAEAIGRLVQLRERARETDAAMKRAAVELREMMADARVLRAAGAVATISKSGSLLVRRSA